MRKIIASLDIGSSLIKLVVGEMTKNKFNVLLAINSESQGIKNGFIVNQESFNEVIVDLFKKAEELLGIKVKKVIVNVPIYNAKYELVEGSTTINNEEYVVGPNDIVRSMQSAVYNKVPDNMELINLIPIIFKINGDILTKEPLGIGAEKLTSKCILVTAPKKGIEPIIKVLEKNQIEIIDLAFCSFGDYEELHDQYDDEETGAIVNIGADTTEVSIFNKGVIHSADVINMGSSNIDKDISYIYHISLSDAKYIKENLALCHTRMAQPNEVIELANEEEETIRINQYEASEIVMERIKEIFNLVKKQINLLTKKEISYIIITGGLTEAADFEIIVDESFGSVAKVANVNEIGARNNIYSSSVGLIKFYNRKLKLRNKDYSIFTLDEQEEFSGLENKKGISENSILGKVFGIFFDK
ncbi:MAG: cell division protein FtsA [Bacilli bacterium]|nr:cell division protein FtsA [Bacilli bacterium]